MRISLLATLALAPFTAHAQQADTHAIVGARVLTVSGPVLDRATIVMRDGLITAVGPEVTPPPGARVIDGKGLVVTPGLIDGLSAIGLPTPPRPASGAGGAASGATSPLAALAPQALALDRVKTTELSKARDAGITTALVIPREGVLPGQSAILNLAGERLEAMVLRQPAALHLHMATATRQYPGSLMGTMAYARQALLDAGRAREAWAAWEKSPRGKKRPAYDAALVPWQQALAGRLPLVVTCTLEGDVRRALSLADEFGLKLVLAGVAQGFRSIDLLRERRLPLLVSVNFDPPRAGGFFGLDEQQERRRIADAERNPAELAKAGVPFALASAWAPDFVAGIRKAVERGLPSETALRAATLGAAEALALSETTGSLETGKLANVVAWSGEPFARDTKARYVFVDGRLYEPDPAEDRRDAGRRANGGGKGGAAPATESAAAGGDAASQPAKPEDEPLPPLPVSPAPFPAGKAVAIKGGSVLTVGPRGDIASGTVLIRDGKIVAVGPDVAVPQDAVVIDATGRYVMPGIIDTHSHTAVEGGVNECTDVITAETRVRDVIDHRDVSIYRQLAGGVTTINVLHGSCNAIGGQNAVLKLRWGKGPDELVFGEAPRGIKFALGENVKRSGFRPPGPPRYPGTRMGVEVVLREGFLRARDYKKEWADYEASRKARPTRAEPTLPPRRDLRLETLADILDGKILVHSHAYRADEMLMLLELADEFGFKVRTFQHGLEAYKLASEIARHGAGVGTFIDWWAYKAEAFSATPYNPGVLASKGVRVSLNSDSDELARRLYWDAAKAVKYGGVSEAEALRMITLNAAWQLGVERQVGSIEPGKHADIAIFSAHPLSAQARCELTLVDGQVYFDRAKDQEARGATAEWAPLASTGGAQ